MAERETLDVWTSACCGAGMTAHGGDGSIQGSRYMLCKACGGHCDAIRDEVETQDTLDALGGSAANASGGAEMAKVSSDGAALSPAAVRVMPTTPDALIDALARELPHWLPREGEAADSAHAAARIIVGRILASTHPQD